MHIDHYSFGRITVDGKTFTSDVIIFPDRVDATWWRKEGHYLQKADLADIVAAEPQLLIVGTGAHGVMTVPEGTLRLLEAKGIETRVLKTADAAELFNRQPAYRRVIAALHLTC